MAKTIGMGVKPKKEKEDGAEVAKLKKEVAELKKENESLKAEVAKLKKPAQA